MTSRNVRYAAPELRPITDVGIEEIRPTTASDIFSLGILLLQVRPCHFHLPVTQAVTSYFIIAISWA
jgi:hypothetical protein